MEAREDAPTPCEILGGVTLRGRETEIVLFAFLIIAKSLGRSSCRPRHLFPASWFLMKKRSTEGRPTVIPPKSQRNSWLITLFTGGGKMHFYFFSSVNCASSRLRDRLQLFCFMYDKSRDVIRYCVPSGPKKCPVVDNNQATF
jgi:hypothetical protein